MKGPEMGKRLNSGDNRVSLFQRNNVRRDFSFKNVLEVANDD